MLRLKQLSVRAYFPNGKTIAEMTVETKYRFIFANLSLKLLKKVTSCNDTQAYQIITNTALKN